MDRVCYILGAGFSAPLGLPLMNTFLVKSKDMFAAEPGRYPHFKEVFEQVERMSVSKNYFNTDLFNIEEILSILEMQSFLEGSGLNETFIKYIKDVIEYHTPNIPPYRHRGAMPQDWYAIIHGEDSRWRNFVPFVAAIANVSFELGNVRFADGRDSQFRIKLKNTDNPPARYSIVTLNYDRVLELVLEFLTNQYSQNAPLTLDAKAYVEDWSQPNYAKLHGSTDSDIIVPPTWSKGIHSGIAPVWKRAYDILVNANHIRFVGYSLPSADAYVRYLLKAAALKAPHLKSIDIVCLDSSGSVKESYEDFVEFKFRRFANARTEAYLDYLAEKMIPSRYLPTTPLVPTIEKAHEEFMQEHSDR